MGQFTLKSKRTVDSKALEATVNISDEDINRITVAYAKLYFPNGVLVPGTPGVPEVPEVPEIPEVPATEAVLDEEGNVLVPANPGSPAVPAVPGVPGVEAIPDSYREPTGQEVFDAIAGGLLQGIINNTVSQERTEAARTAQDSVASISVD